MRFEHLEILRFGKFTDLRLDFPSSGLDFHVIVGANEAGKSTIRAAIADMLFGIESRTNYAFAHDYDELRLGCAIASGELRQQFYRLKRAKHPLRNADDQPLKDDLLQPFLGGMDRLSYERMFCLDHQRLVAGGADILNAKDDLARLLFEASSGITSFGQLRDSLDAEAKSLWDRRRSGDRAFYRAQAELQTAEQELKQSTVRATDWSDAEQRVQAAREAVQSITRNHEALELRRARLERIRRVAPALQKLRAALLEQEQVIDAVRLPPSTRDELIKAEQAIRGAEAVLAQAERARQDAEQRISEITVDQLCIDHAAEIQALADLRARTQQHAADIGKRQAELQTKLDEAQRIGRQLGWEGDDDALERMIPPQTVRAAIQELLQEHGRLAEAVSSTEQAAAEKQHESRLLAAQLEALTVIALPPGMHSVLADAHALGDPDRRIEEAQERMRTMEGRLHLTLQQLRPWTGSVDDLSILVVPADSSTREHQAREQELASRLETQRAALDSLKSELAAQQLAVEQARQAKRVVTADELQQARAHRDELWRSIRNRSTPLDSAAEDFEARVTGSDRLADLRYDGATDVARLEHAEAAVAQTKLRCSQQEQAVAETLRRSTEQASSWTRAMREIGLSGVTPSRFLEWSEQRRKAVELAESVGQAKAEWQALVGSRQRAVSELHASLKACGVDDSDTDALTRKLSAAQGIDSSIAHPVAFKALVAQVADVIRRAEARQAQRHALLQQQQSAHAALATLQARMERARLDMARWEQRWANQIASAKLPAQTTSASAAQALEMFSALSSRLKEIRELRRNRIEAMRRELEAFEAAARKVAASSALDLAQLSAESIALELGRRLSTAQRNAERLRAAKQELERAHVEITRAHTQRELAESQIRPFMRQACVNDIAQLDRAIERSERLYALEASINECRRLCLEGGDGLSIEQLEAEMSAEDVMAIPAQLAQLTRDIAQSTEARDQGVRDLADHENVLKRYAGQSDAASAEGRRQEALASMGGTIDRYIKVFVAARLLRWAIDRYRQDKQGPLLRRAGEVFSVLTQGSFERLIVDFDDKAPQLKGCRPGGKLVDVEGMSDGTRDQLFLALRLAALELQLDQGRALPFVVDDLFINFDDDRAAAGFEALAELATQTQVIFLTHHGHLLPIVEETIGKPANVVRL